jgi:hypothetical protein
MAHAPKHQGNQLHGGGWNLQRQDEVALSIPITNGASFLSQAEPPMFITEMRQGVPCWFELSSTDPDKSFAL